MPEVGERMPGPENSASSPRNYDSFSAFLSDQKARGERIGLDTLPQDLIRNSPFRVPFRALEDTSLSVANGQGGERITEKLIGIREEIEQLSVEADKDSRFAGMGDALIHLSRPFLDLASKQGSSRERGQRQTPRTGESQQRRGAKIPEFEGQTEQEKDNKRVDWIRERLERNERRKRGLSRIEQNRFLYVIESISDEELKESIYSEMSLRSELQGLVLQWETASGSEEAIGKMLGKSRLLNLEQLMDMSDLAEANEGEGKERVSLSVQVSRAMSLYLNFLGVWAEAYGDSEAKKIANPDGVAEYAKGIAKKAQEKLSASRGREGGIEKIDVQGIEAGVLKEIIAKFPKELIGHRSDFVTEIKAANDAVYFDLTKVFGKCMFVEEVTARDILWTKTIVAALSGSASAENMALWMLDFTGETDILNVIWQEKAYRATDFQKLTKMEERRRREAGEGNPFGYEANLGKFPERSGKGWFENAKMEYDPINHPGEKKPIKDILRGWEGFDAKPFHQVDWNLLARDTYIANFLLQNMRYYATFAAVMRADLDYKDLTRQALRAVNKAFKTSFGKKDELRAEYTTEKEWNEHNPWVWYAIGAISDHNPWGEKQLPGMQRPSSVGNQWQIGPDSTLGTIKEQAKGRPTYYNDVERNLAGSKFLTQEELLFVIDFCKGKIKEK